MIKVPIVLLPGLDGTGLLCARFINAAPRHADITTLRLPLGRLSYDELADRMSPQLPGGPVVIIAESFSGPIAIELARRHPTSALVFCNSFVTSPRSRLLRSLALPILFKGRPPRLLTRHYLVGRAADDSLVLDVRNTIGSVPPDVLAFRVRLVLGFDKRKAFALTKMPALYLASTDDALVPASASRQMASLRPLTIVRLAGPHLLLQASPVAAWDAISRFLHDAVVS